MSGWRRFRCSNLEAASAKTDFQRLLVGSRVPLFAFSLHSKLIRLPQHRTDLCISYLPYLARLSLWYASSLDSSVVDVWGQISNIWATTSLIEIRQMRWHRDVIRDQPSTTCSLPPAFRKSAVLRGTRLAMLASQPCCSLRHGGELSLPSDSRVLLFTPSRRKIGRGNGKNNSIKMFFYHFSSPICILFQNRKPGGTSPSYGLPKWVYHILHLMRPDDR